MTSYIEKTHPNLFGGKFAVTVSFKRGLNILSGENGTGKTQLLMALKKGLFVGKDGQSRILAFSPMRNAQRKSVDSLIQEARTQSKDLAAYFEERSRRDLQDNSFDAYASFADLFYICWKNACKDGGSQIDKMVQVGEEFNTVLGKIFQGVPTNS